MRLGYMGHLSLIAEETVKLFERYPELRSAVESSIPQPDWDTFVSTTLRETRERDHTPLDGANAALGLALNKAPSSASLSDEDDEFPMNSARAMRAMEAAGMAAGGSGEGAFGKAGGLELGGTGGLSDPVRLSSPPSVPSRRLTCPSRSSLDTSPMLSRTTALLAARTRTRKTKLGLAAAASTLAGPTSTSTLPLESRFLAFTTALMVPVLLPSPYVDLKSRLSLRFRRSASRRQRY